jgi:hypothetical protein
VYKRQAENKEGYKGLNGIILFLLFNIEKEKILMSAYYPPTNFFQNINFNNDFYAIPNNNQGISLAYANTHYLFSTGVATSTAITTLFSGSVGIGTIGGNAGTLNALNINAVNSLHRNSWRTCITA